MSFMVTINGHETVLKNLKLVTKSAEYIGSHAVRVGTRLEYGIYQHERPNRFKGARGPKYLSRGVESVHHLLLGDIKDGLESNEPEKAFLKVGYRVVTPSREFSPRKTGQLYRSIISTTVSKGGGI